MKIVVSKDFIKRDLNCEKDQRRNSNYIRELFNMSKKDEFTIDDQTWSDLSMDNVFNKLDRTYSSYGESSLYKMLRNPILNKDALKNRGQLIDLFESNIELTVNLRKVFFEMCYDKKNITSESINHHIKKADYSMLPAYLLYTKYNNKDYIFAMNGQTGKMTGNIPIDPGKVTKFVLGTGSLLSIIATLVFLFIL